MSKPKQFHLEISSDMANLEPVSNFMLDVARQIGLDEKQTDHVQMAVDEAVTNVMEHAYSGRADGRIEIACRADTRALHIEIRDQGEPFDADTIQEPDISKPLSERAIGGLGVFFMRKLMSKVEFTRDAGGNLTRLTLNLK